MPCRSLSVARCCRVVGVDDMCVFILYFFLFKQKTAYEMRISDWSSDVCSSDLAVYPPDQMMDMPSAGFGDGLTANRAPAALFHPKPNELLPPLQRVDRKSVV